MNSEEEEGKDQEFEYHNANCHATLMCYRESAPLSNLIRDYVEFWS